LNPAAEVKPATPTAKQEKTAVSQNSKQQKQLKPKRMTTSQIVTIVAMILLFLLVFLAIICRYWSDITQALVQILSSLFTP
jgi:CHASE3 domain sensor protein